MTEPERKVVDAEVVRDAEPQDVKHVRVSRIKSSRLFSSLLPSRAEQEEGRRNLRELRIRMWLWLIGLLAIGGACFYGAAATDVVIWAAFLLIAGATCLLAAAVVGAVIWALRRLMPR